MPAGKYTVEYESDAAALIAAEIAATANDASLNPFTADDATRELAARYEGELFWAAVTSIPPSRILRKLFSELSVGHAFRFLKDRAGVAKNARTRPVARKEAVPLYQSHLETVEQHLASSGDFLTNAAAHGLGIVMQPTFIASDSIRRGNLVPVLEAYEWPLATAYAVYPPTRHLSYRVRAFIDFLVERFSATPQWDRECETLNARQT